MVWDGGQDSQVPVSGSVGIHWEAGRPPSLPQWCPHPILCRSSEVLGDARQVPRNEGSAREAVLSRLEAMLTSIDETPLTRKQKLLLYSGGVCPRLTWPLLIQEFPTTWMDRQVDSLVTRYLKKWSGLGRSGNVALLYLPRSLGGQNLPRLSTLHKRLQVSRQCQFLTSQDSCVRFLADCGLQREQHLTRRKFRPAEVAREALSVSPGGSRKSLVRISKVLVSEEVNSALISDLQGLQRQGQMSRRTDPICAPIWARVVQTLPDELMKFALNAAVD